MLSPRYFLPQVANLRRRLFALFAHPAAGVFETVALIMRTIAEEDGGAAEPMRDAALKDGALLRHLVSCLAHVCQRMSQPQLSVVAV